VPETDRDRYLAGFEADAYELFSSTLYEESGPQTPDAFNFDIRSEDAPHYRLPIYWSRAFVDWDPLRREVTAEQIDAAFGAFLPMATDLLLGSGAQSA
jgi:hypothetical protein